MTVQNPEHKFNPKNSPTKVVEKKELIGPRSYTNFAFNPKNKPADFAKHIIDLKKAGTGLIKAWSPSSLKTFETCRFQSYLKKVLKLPTEQHPAAERGNAIHDMAESYVNGVADKWNKELEPKKLSHFQTDFDELRELYTCAQVELEGQWACDTDWNITDWMSPNTWGRMKLDALRWHTDTHATVIDYKTGRKYGYEITHADQAIIYTVAAFMRIPQLELVDTSFWYLDQGEKSFSQRFTRNQAMTFLPRIADRATIMTSALEGDFKPQPSIYNCRWCPFNREENGCEWRHVT